jgi:DNA repair protein RAD5
MFVRNPILTLPPVETKDIPVQFSPAEREFYDALHRKSLSLFEGFVQAGTASKSWLAIFSLLHRLRQSCDHVALTVKSHLDDEEWANHIAQNPDRTSNKAAVGISETATIDKKFLDDLMGKFRSMQSKDKRGQAAGDAPYAAKIAQMLNEAVESKSSILNEECSICLDPINIHESVVTPCFHIFCKGCLVGVLRQPNASRVLSEPFQSSTMLRLPNGPCPVCNEDVDSSKILRLSESGGHIQTSYLLTSMVQPTVVANREGDGIARQTLETAVRGSSSSKLTAILQELEVVWEEEPGSKVLIFSQFLGFLDLMEETFKKTKIPYARLDGKLSLKDRVSVLKEFGTERDDYETKKPTVGSVLLISMKAGGVGLNLVSANTVFIADRWWNAAVEDQCVDRIHRIGQTAERVRVRKFYVVNTVEERIVELQKRKKNVANEVLCDAGQVDAGGQAGSLPTLDDFKILFQE